MPRIVRWAFLTILAACIVLSGWWWRGAEGEFSDVRRRAIWKLNDVVLSINPRWDVLSLFPTGWSTLP